MWIRGIGTALQSGFERKGIWNYCSKPLSETKVTMQQHQLQPTIVASGFRRLPVGDRTKVASDCQGASQAAGDARPTGAVERMRVTRNRTRRLGHARPYLVVRSILALARGQSAKKNKTLSWPLQYERADIF